MSSQGLVVFLDVDVDDVLVVELPGQSQVVGALRTGTEIVLAVVLLAELLDRLDGRDVHEAWVLDFTSLNLKPRLILGLLLLHDKGLVFEVIFGNVDVAMDAANDLLVVLLHVALLALKDNAEIVIELFPILSLAVLDH